MKDIVPETTQQGQGKTAEHSPVPWWLLMVVEHPTGPVYDTSVAKTCNMLGNAEQMANLFAASPDLLAALIEFVQCNDGEHTIEMYRRARAAIAKAEGGAS